MKVVNRVKKHEEFNEIISTGKKFKSSTLAVFYRSNINGYTRIGVAVGKKNGKAVQRVKIKRQIRAMIAKRNDYSLSIDLIIVVKPSYDTTLFSKNETELNELLNKIKEELN